MQLRALRNDYSISSGNAFPPAFAKQFSFWILDRFEKELRN